MLKAIVCVSYDETNKNNPYSWGIGKNNQLLFNIKSDMNFFKTTTLNKTVVCGLNTLLSFPGGKPLKNRNTIVLCPEGVEPEGCTIYHDFKTMLANIKELAKTEDVFVIGGGMLYNSLNYYCDEVLVTKVNTIDKEATVFYPNLDTSNLFKCVYESEPVTEDQYSFKFCTYKKIKLTNAYTITDIDAYDAAFSKE